MNKLIPVVLIIIVMLVPVSSSFSKEKKSKGTSASAPQEPAASPSAGGWKDVRTNAPAMIKASYRIEGPYIVILLKNLSQNKMLRVKYQAKWKKLDKGKWVDDATSDGLTVRLKKLEDVKKEVRTHSKDIKDVVIEVEASEVS